MPQSPFSGPITGVSTNKSNVSTEPMNDSTKRPDDPARWLSHGLEGDSTALRHLVNAMRPVVQTRVIRALRRRAHNARGRDLRQDAEDLVQDVFAALFARNARALRAWDPKRGLSFLGFVGFLSEREVSIRLRTAKRHPWIEDPTAAETLDRALGAVPCPSTRLEARDALVKVLNELGQWMSPEGRRYFQLLYVDGRSVHDAALNAGTTTNAVYAWRSRLMKKARTLRAA